MCCLHGEAQFFTFQNDWFTYSSFFYEEDLMSNQIRSIDIWKSKKKDGKKFGREKRILNYQFDPKGRLTLARKYNYSSNNVSSSDHLYQYDEAGKLFQKDEISKLFHFTFLNLNVSQKLHKRIKINQKTNPSDTAYIRIVETNNTPNSYEQIIKNENGVAFKKILEEYDSKGRLTNRRVSYVRNRNYTELTLMYNNDLLTDRISSNYFSKKNTVHWQIEYQDELPYLIKVYENDEFIKKYAFVYSEKNLPESIIERNFEDKNVSVYRLEYNATLPQN